METKPPDTRPENGADDETTEPALSQKAARSGGVAISYSWVRQVLQGAGLVAKRRRCGPRRRRRERRPLTGMLLHCDCRRHRWFQDDRWYDLVVILNDAPGEIYYAQLVEEESTCTVMQGLREVIESKGPSVYSTATAAATSS